ncbi:MAG: endonuclease domain-containing protein, partial [Chloroflexaceae bacterium]|nr:endonuclease domain-containing protein [Chloroflexaceae bacterium]
ALLARCRALRRNATSAENMLWHLLRNRQLGGAKFRRQHPVIGYILDFYCHEARLAVEVDGSHHAAPQQARYDRERTERLEQEGIQVLRFWNNQVLHEPEQVLEAIWTVLNAPLTPNPSPAERGEPLHPLPAGEGRDEGTN